MQVVARTGPAGSTAELQLRGELDIASAPELAGVLERLLATEHRVIVLDLAELSFLDCAGMRPIRSALCILREEGGTLVVRHAQPLVEQALRVAGLAEALDAGRQLLA